MLPNGQANTFRTCLQATLNKIIFHLSYLLWKIKLKEKRSLSCNCCVLSVIIKLLYCVIWAVSWLSATGEILDEVNLPRRVPGETCQLYLNQIDWTRVGEEGSHEAVLYYQNLFFNNTFTVWSNPSCEGLRGRIEEERLGGMEESHYSRVTLLWPQMSCNIQS